MPFLRGGGTKTVSMPHVPQIINSRRCKEQFLNELLPTPPPRTQVDSMVEERLYHSSSLIAGEVWMVSGGTDGVAWRDTTEFWRDGRFQEGPRWGNELLTEWMVFKVFCSVSDSWSRSSSPARYF